MTVDLTVFDISRIRATFTQDDKESTGLHIAGKSLASG